MSEYELRLQGWAQIGEQYADNPDHDSAHDALSCYKLHVLGRGFPFVSTASMEAAFVSAFEQARGES